MVFGGVPIFGSECPFVDGLEVGLISVRCSRCAVFAHIFQSLLLDEMCPGCGQCVPFFVFSKTPLKKACAMFIVPNGRSCEGNGMRRKSKCGKSKFQRIFLQPFFVEFRINIRKFHFFRIFCLLRRTSEDFRSSVNLEVFPVFPLITKQ